MGATGRSAAQGRARPAAPGRPEEQRELGRQHSCTQSREGAGGDAGRKQAPAFFKMFNIYFYKQVT